MAGEFFYGRGKPLLASAWRCGTEKALRSDSRQFRMFLYQLSFGNQRHFIKKNRCISKLVSTYKAIGMMDKYFEDLRLESLLHNDQSQ
jgi:hypothetical protein